MLSHCAPSLDLQQTQQGELARGGHCVWKNPGTFNCGWKKVQLEETLLARRQKTL